MQHERTAAVMGSHLSDEAVAAFADGVLRGHARGRAARHVEECLECRHAVRAQRETVLALRRAPAPSLPAGLFERLQGVPADAPPVPEPVPPSQPGFPPLAPMAAFVPAERQPGQHGPADTDSERGMWGLAALFAARARRRP